MTHHLWDLAMYGRAMQLRNGQALVGRLLRCARHPGSFGTFAGLQTDGHASVLDEDGHPIPGLYAAGTDMASVMGGHDPAGGINLGPALTFGFIAGRHAAEAAL